MQGAFGTVVILVSAVGIVGAVVALLLSGRTWDSYSRGHLLRDNEAPAGPRRGSPERPGGGGAAGSLGAGAAGSLGAGAAGSLGAGAAGSLGAGAAVADAERAEEIRQMMEARNARRRRRGEPELDVERELARLAGPAVDPALRAEIRDLVVARNHRRARRGEPPLDVEAEVERQIAALGDL